MRKRIPFVVVASFAFIVSAGLSRSGGRVEFPAPAYAAGTCSLPAVVCGNDSAPGCEIICGGEQQAVCIEGSCTPAGNIQAPNRCTCK